MVLTLGYRRPSHQNTSAASVNGDEKAKSINDSIESGSSGASNGIPEALSFDRIIAGGVCPPCTLRDFMNYLKYIEHSAENLQFFLWFRDYVERFNNLPESEKVLSQEWTLDQAESELTGQNVRRQKVNPMIAEALKGTDFDNRAPRANHNDIDPFNDRASTPSSTDEKRGMSSDYSSSFGDAKAGADGDVYGARADEAFDEAGLQWKPFTAQPFRQEITRIIAIYLSIDAPRQLNLSNRERSAVLHALQNTTHPSAFRPAIISVEYALRMQAHINFIRWTICNGNRPRVIFARGLGLFGILAGLIASILIVLSSAGRGWRVIPFAGFFIGISTLIAAIKGMCVVLHGMHHRHLRPWELFADDESEVIETRDLSKESLLSVSTNSYEDEPWVARYEKRNIVRKVFDREIWVEEPMLRQIQDTIFVQAIIGAFVGSAILTGIFCAVPHGNFY